MRTRLTALIVSLMFAGSLCAQLPKQGTGGGGGGGGVGTVTSVGVAGTAGEITVTGTSPITGSGSLTLSQAYNATNAQTGTTYALLTGDRGKLVTLTNANPIAASIAAAGSTGFADGWETTVLNSGAGTATITPTTSTIEGAATLVLTTGQAARIWSNGTNYRATRLGKVAAATLADTVTNGVTAANNITDAYAVVGDGGAKGVKVGAAIAAAATASTIALRNASGEVIAANTVATGKTALATDGSAASLTSFPTLNQSTSGTAANLSGTPALPNGTTATTQTQADASTKLATTAYVDTGLGGKQAALTGPMTQATPNSVDNCIPVGVGTSGTAFECTPVTIDPSTGAIGGTVSLAGTNVPFTQTGTGATARTVDAVLKDTLRATDFAGADAGVKINACIVALPAAGGTCDATGLTGAQTAAATITVLTKTTLLLGATTLTLSGGPGMTYDSYSQIAGINPEATITVSAVASSSIIAPVNTAVRTYSSAVRRMTIHSTNSTASICLNVKNQSHGRFEDLEIIGNSSSGTGRGVLLDGTGGAAYYNEFYGVTVNANLVGVDIDNGANDNHFYGGTASSNGTGFRIGLSATTNGNSAFGTSLESNITDNINLGAFALENKFIYNRIESASIPYVTNANAAGNYNNIILYPYLVLGTGYVDAGGTLQRIHTSLASNQLIGDVSVPYTFYNAIGPYIQLRSGASGSPAMRSALDFNTNQDFKARGNMYTSQDQADQWFSGVPYTGGRWQIGYAATSADPYTVANARFTVTPTTATFAPTVAVSATPGGSVPSWKTYHLVSIANGANGCANATGCWQVNGVLGANRAAQLTQDVVLFQLPANGYVSDMRIQTAVACTGATTALTGLGTAGNNVLYRAATYDIAASVSTTNMTNTIAATGSDYSSALNIVASLVTTSGAQYVNTLAAGCAIDYSLLWGVTQ